MKAFIAYRFTGEDLTKLEPLLVGIRDSLKKKDIDSYCSFFDEEVFQGRSFTAQQIMAHAFREIDQSDFLFVLQTSDHKSEGLLMEVGYCIAKSMPVVVAVQSEVSQTYVPEMGNVVVRWTDVGQLVTEIEKIDFKELTTS
jgi:nucleoside 2-deoxyribosyltransferase